MYIGVYTMFFFFKQKTAYEMRISDWSSDVCSSDLGDRIRGAQVDRRVADPAVAPAAHGADPAQHQGDTRPRPRDRPVQGGNRGQDDRPHRRAPLSDRKSVG